MSIRPMWPLNRAACSFGNGIFPNAAFPEYRFHALASILPQG